MKKAIYLAIFILFLSGCDVTVHDKEIVLDPNETKIETGIEAGLSLMELLAMFIPGVGVPTAIAGKAYHSYKKKREENDANYAGGAALAAGLEELKQTLPETWEKVAPYLDKTVKATDEIHAAVNGFRENT